MLTVLHCFEMEYFKLSTHLLVVFPFFFLSFHYFVFMCLTVSVLPYGPFILFSPIYLKTVPLGSDLLATDVKTTSKNNCEPMRIQDPVCRSVPSDSLQP